MSFKHTNQNIIFEQIKQSSLALLSQHTNKPFNAKRPALRVQLVVADSMTLLDCMQETKSEGSGADTHQ